MEHAAERQTAVLRAYRALADRHLSQVARRHGMHATDTLALSHLLDQTNRGRVVTPGDLSALLSLSGPATTAAIDRLERRGVVERRPSQADGRRTELHVVEGDAGGAGQAMFGDFTDAVAAVMARHSQSEVEAFTTIMADLCSELVVLSDARPELA